MRNLNILLTLTFLVTTLSGCGGDDSPNNGSDGTDTSGDGDGDGDGDPGEEGEAEGDGDGDPAGDGDGDPTTGDGDGDPTTGDGDGDPTTGDGDGDPTTGDGDGDGDAIGYCAQGCEEDADCCPNGAPNCPSENYPDNYFCSDAGVCEFGGCDNDDDCGGLVSEEECHPIDELPTCFAPCVNNSDCLLQPGTTCIGLSDDDVKYCAPEPAAGCENDADCAGLGICDVESGECYCEQDGNCTAMGIDTCVLE